MEEANRRSSSTERLTELLRRCHRHELGPLARALGITSDDYGLADLSQRIAKILRRRGGNDLFNLIMRTGEGPGYDEVLRDLADRLDVLQGKTVYDNERVLLQHWVNTAWEQLDDEQRHTLTQQLGITPSKTKTGTQLVRQTTPLDRLRHVLGLGLLGMVTLSALFPFVVAWHYSRPDDSLLLPVVLEVARLRQAVKHRVTVGVVGSPSSGKDAAIKAIFGLDSGNVSPVAGSTTEVEINQLQGASALFVVNTPGMGDIIEAVTEEAKQVLQLIDVYVYVVNAQGGVQAREKADYDEAVATGRPVLAVVNKIDTLRERDRKRYLDDARQKLGAAEEDFMAVAFDPLPQLSEHPIGLEPVRTWLREHLIEQGKAAEELTMLA